MNQDNLFTDEPALKTDNLFTDEPAPTTSLLDKAKGAYQAYEKSPLAQVEKFSPTGMLNTANDLIHEGANKLGEKATESIGGNQNFPDVLKPYQNQIAAGVGTVTQMAPDLATMAIPSGEASPVADSLERFAGKKAIQSLELPNVGEMLPEERNVLSKFIQDNGLVGRDKTKILEHARDLSKQFGEKIGEIGDKSGGLTASREVLQDNIQGLIEKANKFKGYENKEAQTLARDYQDGARDIFNKVFDDPSWNNIQEMKQQYGKLAFDSKGEVKSEGAKDTYFALKNMLKDIADQSQSNPNLGQEYKEALSGYSQMQPLESSLEKSVNSEFRGGSGMGVRGLAGLVKKLPGPVRAVAGPAAVAMGHPIVGLAAALPELTDAALQSKAASGIANAARNAPSNPGAISNLVNDYLKKHFQDQNATH